MKYHLTTSDSKNDFNFKSCEVYNLNLNNIYRKYSCDEIEKNII